MPANYKRSLFVDREKELAFIEKQITKLNENGTLVMKERVIRYERVEGIGNSWLCCKLKETYSDEGSLFVYYHDLDANPGRTDDDKMRVILTQLGRTLESYGASVTQAVYNDSTRLPAMGSFIDQALREELNGQALLILFDNLHLASKKLRTNIESFLLLYVINHPRSLSILFGDRGDGWVEQGPLIKKTHNSWEAPIPRNIHLRRLPPFTQKDTETQLTLLGIPNKDLYPKVHFVSGGKPGHSDELARLHEDLLNRYFEFPLAFEKDKLLQTIPEDLHPAIVALCALGRDFTFTVEEIGELLNNFAYRPAGSWNGAAISALREKLVNLFINDRLLTFADPIRHKFDEETRSTLQEEFRLRDPARWVQLHQLMEQICKKSSEKGHDLEVRTKWKKRAQHHAECANRPDVKPGWLCEEEE